jgi:hypothetical protein
MLNLNVLVQRHGNHRKNNAYIMSMYDVVTEIITEIIKNKPLYIIKKNLKNLLQNIYILII